MTDEALKQMLKKEGRTHYVIGQKSNGDWVRTSENMTLENAKSWDAGILKSWYEKFKIVEDTDL